MSKSIPYYYSMNIKQLTVLRAFFSNISHRHAAFENCDLPLKGLHFLYEPALISCTFLESFNFQRCFLSFNPSRDKIQCEFTEKNDQTWKNCFMFMNDHIIKLDLKQNVQVHTTMSMNVKVVTFLCEILFISKAQTLSLSDYLKQLTLLEYFTSLKLSRTPQQ